MFSGARWREPYLAWYQAFDALADNRNRAVLDHPAPAALICDVANHCGLASLLYDATQQVVHRHQEPWPTGTRMMSVEEAHDRFGGATILEVREHGSARVS